MKNFLPKKTKWRRKEIKHWLPKRKKKFRFFRLFFFFSLFVFLLTCLFFLAVYFLVAKDLPSPDKFLERNIIQSTKIYDRTGQTVLYEIFNDQRRTLVELSDIPKNLIWATIVIEDKTFYEHKGFSLKSIARAIFVNFFRGGQKIQGGSTITQQLIKNVILTPEKTYARKIRELILAWQIEKKFSKDQILKMYLNEIPYGSNAYGVEAAAQIYFNKSVKNLTLDEAALLAALPKAPSYYSPFGSHKEKLIQRQKYILEQMLNLGFISEAEAEKAKTTETLAKIKPRKERMLAPHFVILVKEQLIEKYGYRLVEQGGLKVFTTLDLEKQKIAEEVIRKNEENLKKFGATNTALVALDVKSGEILAMVGSRDYFDEKIDGYVNVALSPRQPGSSFKPIVYTKAFEKGYTPETILFDVLTNFGPDGSGKDYLPQNYDLKERGPITMRKALAGSLNIPGVQTLYLAGLDQVINLAEKMGYTTFSDRSRFGLSVVLGGAEVKLLEHTAAFGIFAREGLKIPTFSVLKVEDSTGKVLEEKLEVQPEEVLSPQITRQINDILSDNKSRAFIFGEKNVLTLPGRPVAAKTGTTNNWKDGWTIGYTPSLVTGVWVGNSRGEEMKRGADGVKTAGPIWHDFMKEVLKNTPVENFTPPTPEEIDKPILKGEIPETITVKIDRASGKLATIFTPKSFIIEKKFRIYHSILHFVDKDNPRGPIPEDPSQDPMYKRWEEAIQKWAKKQAISFELPPTEYDDLHTPWHQPQVTILSPLDGSFLNPGLISVKAQAQAPREIRRMELYLENQLVEVVYSNSALFSLNTTGLPTGFCKIMVRAYDDIDNMGEAMININFTQSLSPVIFWLSPSNNEDIYLERFPLTFSLALPKTKIKEVKFYYRQFGQERVLFSTITNLSSLRLNTSWLEAPSTGYYEFFVEAINENNQLIESEKINLTIL